MVDPDHRGTGLFIEIQNELNRTLHETKGKLITDDRIPCILTPEL